jgi:hypothetical protein
MIDWTCVDEKSTNCPFRNCDSNALAGLTYDEDLSLAMESCISFDFSAINNALLRNSRF